VTRTRKNLVFAGLGSLLLAALGGIGFARWIRSFDKPFDPARLSVTVGSPRPLVAAQTETLRAFYSGHSLSDGIPEQVLEIATSLGRGLEFEFQSIPGSPIRLRTRGTDPSATGFPGLKTGRNRHGSGLDVEAELRKRYDVLVVTERHDLPYAAVTEHTAEYLRVLHDLAVRGNAGAQTLLYHGWLPIDFGAPEEFVAYERAALVLWECVASAVNARLATDRRNERVKVLPGATALADLVEQLARGGVPGVAESSAHERVRLLFSDDVHLAPPGRYFLGAVHYAALFGKSPEGAAVPAEIPVELGRYMQRLAWEHVEGYSMRAEAAAERALDVCRDYAAQVMCPRLFARFDRRKGGIEGLKNVKRKLDLQRVYADPDHPDNPFG